MGFGYRLFPLCRCRRIRSRSRYGLVGIMLLKDAVAKAEKLADRIIGAFERRGLANYEFVARDDLKTILVLVFLRAIIARESKGKEGTKDAN